MQLFGYPAASVFNKLSQLTYLATIFSPLEQEIFL